MAQFQVLVTMIVEAHSDSEAWSQAQSVLDDVTQGDILACEVDEVMPDRRGRLTLTDLDNTLD